jgi:acyl dehydratase
VPIDVDKALGAPLAAVESSWGPDQVILYHLGLGAGARPTDERELAYTYEDGLTVLPSFGVIPVFPALAAFASVAGIDIDPAMVLHGEQDLEIRKPIPVRGHATSEGRVAAIHDKGTGALIVLEVETRGHRGDVLFVNRFSAFVRGEGGFGGDPGPKPGNHAPDRPADFQVASPTLPQQALLYRLSGDKNPLHADPAVARTVGFDQPILHGLCTYGIVCKAVVDAALDGDTTAVARYRARFANVVLPGETIVTEGWHEDGRILLRARTRERDLPVLTNAAITLR